MVCFSLKVCKPLLKDESKSPVFTKSGKATLINNYVYSLIAKGVRGSLKKESVVSTLSDLVVRILFYLYTN